MSALGGRFDGMRVLDLFAGSGALGLEMLSRGADSVVFVELARGAQAILRTNVELLGAGERCTLVRARAERWVETLDVGAFDLAVADPPYGRGLAEAVLETFARRPFAAELWVEHRSDETIPDLPGLRHRRYGDTTLTSLVQEKIGP
jgi:16S rRNA (guanine966-N2)-methyltransferase